MVSVALIDTIIYHSNFYFFLLETVLDSSYPSHTTATPFHRTDPFQHRSVFVIKTDPLFVVPPSGIPLLSAIMSRSFKFIDLDSTRRVSRDNSNMVETRFRFTNSIQHAHNMSIPFPNIRDGDGRLIMPNEYKSRLEDGSIVIVNASLRLYVILINKISAKVIVIFL